MNTYDNKKQFSQMFIRQNECCLCLLRSPSAICYKMINETEWKRNGTERQNECCLCLLRSPSAISYKMIINGTERNGKMNTCDNKKQFSPMFIRQKEKNVCWVCVFRWLGVPWQARLAPEGDSNSQTNDVSKQFKNTKVVMLNTLA